MNFFYFLAAILAASLSPPVHAKWVFSDRRLLAGEDVRAATKVTYITSEISQSSQYWQRLKNATDDYRNGLLAATALDKVYIDAQAKIMQLLTNITEISPDVLEKRIMADVATWQNSLDDESRYFFMLAVFTTTYTSEEPSNTIVAKLQESFSDNGALTTLLTLLPGTHLTESDRNISLESDSTFQVTINTETPTNWNTIFQQAQTLWDVPSKRIIMAEASKADTFSSWTYFITPDQNQAKNLHSKAALWFSLRSSELATFFNASTVEITELTVNFVAPFTLSAEINAMLTNAQSDELQAIIKANLTEIFRDIQTSRSLNSFGNVFSRLQISDIKQVQLPDSNITHTFKISINSPIYRKLEDYLNDETFYYINYFISDTLNGKIWFPVGEGSQFKLDSVQRVSQVPSRLEDECTSVCAIANSVCWEDGSGAATRRCYCQNGFVPYDGDQCERLVTSYTEPQCRSCELGGGICFGTAAKLGCQCSPGRGSEFVGSKAACDRQYLTVDCQASLMTISYEPFDVAKGLSWRGHAQDLLNASHYELSKAAIYIAGYESQEPCKFSYRNGRWQLTLDLQDSSLKYCNTEKFLKTNAIVRYKNTIEVRNRYNEVLQMNAFCDRETKLTVKSSAADVNKKFAGSIGHVNSANVSLTIFNSNDQPLSGSARVAEYEELRLVLTMDDNSNLFKAIKVTYCSASDQEDPTEETSISLIEEGCPAAGQLHVGLTNLFARVNGNPQQLETQPQGIQAFRLPNSQSARLMFHCTVNLCEDTEDCLPTKCGSKRKRSAGFNDNVAKISAGVFVGATHYRIAETENQSEVLQFLSSSNFTVLIVAASCVLIVAIIGLVILKKRSDSQNNSQIWRSGALEQKYLPL